jgi:uncharacterized protein YndB with AHSA1/START domain
VREVRVAAPPAEVFRFFVEPDKMILWKATAAELDPRPGGAFRIDVNGRNVARGEFIEVDPPHRLVFSWGWEASDDFPPGVSRVEITFTDTRAGETLVRLTHYGIPVDLRADNAAGWDLYLPRLQLAASGQPVGRDPWAP